MNCERQAKHIDSHSNLKARDACPLPITGDRAHSTLASQPVPATGYKWHPFLEYGKTKPISAILPAPCAKSHERTQFACSPAVALTHTPIQSRKTKPISNLTPSSEDTCLSYTSQFAGRFGQPPWHSCETARTKPISPLYRPAVCTYPRSAGFEQRNPISAEFIYRPDRRGAKTARTNPIYPRLIGGAFRNAPAGA